MKIIKATCTSETKTVITKDGKKLYKAAFETEEDVFIAYAEHGTQIGDTEHFIKVYEEGKGTKYKRVEV